MTAAPCLRAMLSRSSARVGAELEAGLRDGSVRRVEPKLRRICECCRGCGYIIPLEPGRALPPAPEVAR